MIDHSELAPLHFTCFHCCMDDWAIWRVRRAATDHLQFQLTDDGELRHVRRHDCVYSGQLYLDAGRSAGYGD